jgi:hypothetical protein
MSRRPAHDAPAHWLEGLPEREIYDVYAETINQRFPAFAVRNFDDARVDMAQTLHPHDPTSAVDQALVDVIVTPDSHERFIHDLEAYVAKHGLAGWVDAGESLLVVTDHGQFTDVPVTAETLGRIGLGRRSTTVQVVSEMISLMGLDVGTGPFDVIRTLRHISGVVQTVPRLDGSPSDDLRRYRDRKNATGLHVLQAVRDTEGSITVMSLVARHNVTSKNGSTLYIHEPNRRTLEAYVSPNVKVVPICIDCPTFRDDGTAAPADMRSELFEPMRVTDPRVDTRTIVGMFRDATNRMVGDRYKHGVKVRSWRAQMTAARVRSVLPSDRETTDSDY